MTTIEPATKPARKPFINEEAQKQITEALKVGCGLETCAALVGVPPWRITNKMTRSGKFRRAINTADAQFELDHIKNIHEASKETKNWRASCWLLERRAVHHFRKRPAEAIHKDQIQPILEAFAKVLVSAIPDEPTRQSALARFDQAIAELFGPQPSTSQPAA